MSRQSAGAAIRALRESRHWTLADLAAATEISIMGLSNLERGTRKPHRNTVAKLENGLGLPPGTYALLTVSADPDAEVAQLISATAEPQTASGTAARPDPKTEATTFGDYAQTQLAELNSVIAQLPPAPSREHETYLRSVLTQCVNAEMLAATSWRVTVNSGGDPNGPLLHHLKAANTLRTELLARLPDNTSSRFDSACTASSLPEPVLAALLGLSTDDIWQIRAGGHIPTTALPRIRAFLDTATPTENPPTRT
jgi:transcriptional regulator with XRE-family HTH domain